jgi:hypothetical protein
MTRLAVILLAVILMLAAAAGTYGVLSALAAPRPAGPLPAIRTLTPEATLTP